MGQPTQRATNYTARSNIEPAQIFLHANGQSAPRSGGARDVGRGAGSHTLSTASESFLDTCFVVGGVRVRRLHIEYAERRIKYGILFIFSPIYKYSNLEYEHVTV